MSIKKANWAMSHYQHV